MLILFPLHLTSRPQDYSFIIEFSNISFVFFSDLSNNQLTGIIPSSIGNLVKLFTLYVLIVSHCDTTQPNWLNRNLLNFVFCSGLLFRSLQYNQLNGMIPSSIGNLVGLHTLYVDSFLISPLTRIRTILTRFFRLNLNISFFRTLSSNQLTGTIPSSIGNLAQLRTLYVNFFFVLFKGIRWWLTLFTYIIIGISFQGFKYQSIDRTDSFVVR